MSELWEFQIGANKTSLSVKVLRPQSKIKMPTSVLVTNVSNSPPHNDPATNILEITISYSRQQQIGENADSFSRLFPRYTFPVNKSDVLYLTYHLWLHVTMTLSMSTMICQEIVLFHHQNLVSMSFEFVSVLRSYSRLRRTKVAPKEYSRSFWLRWPGRSWPDCPEFGPPRGPRWSLGYFMSINSRDMN